MPHYEELFSTLLSDQVPLAAFSSDSNGMPGWNRPSLFESTGVLSGGTLSINSGDNTKFDMSAGLYGFADYSTNAAQPTRVLLTKAAVTAQTVTGIGSSIATYVGVDSAGVIQQQSTPFTNIQRRTIAQVGVLVHSNMVNLNAINSIAAPVRAGISQLHDLMTAIGVLNVSGNIVSANGANLNINKSSGSIFKVGANFFTNPLDPHLTTLAALVAPATIRYRLSTSTEYANTAVIDPGNYESPLGTRVALSGANKFSVQRIALFTSNLIRIQYGQTEYNSMNEAEAAIPTAAFVTESNIAENGVLIGYLILRRSTTDLTNTSDAKFISIGKFGAAASSGAALTSTDQLPEGVVNLYYTDARARAAVITSSITNGDTTHSPSGDAVFDALALTQPLDATLTGIAALTPTANQGIYASGTDTFSTYSLTAGGRALGAVTGTADNLPYFSALNTAAITPLTAFARTLLDDTTAAAAATTLGLGTGDTPTFTGVTTTGLATLASAVNQGSLQATRISATSVTPVWQLHGTGAVSANQNSAEGLFRWSGDANPGSLIFSKSRGTTVGSHTVVNDGDIIGRVSFSGSDGAGFFEAARISVAVSGAPATGSVPGAISFLTTAVGAGAPTTALVLNADNSGAFSAGLGVATTLVVGNTAAIPANTRALIDRIGTGTLPTLPGGTALTLQGNNSSANNNYLVNIAGATGQAGIRFGDSAAASQGRVDYDNATDSFGIYTNATLALTITSAQAVQAAGAFSAASGAFNTSTLRAFTSGGSAATPVLQVNGTAVATSSIGAAVWAASNTAPTVFLGYSANAAVGSHTVVANNNVLGVLSFNGSDGTVFREAARIEAFVNGTPGSSDMPGALRFLVTPDGSATAAAALTINQDKTADFASSITTVGGTSSARWLASYASAVIGTATTADAQASGFFMYSAGSASANRRWGIVKNATSETGSNAGSDLEVWNYNDSGTLLGTALSVARSTSLVTLAGLLTGANIYNTYTPTLTGITNVSSSSANVSGWIRIGNAVLVFTRISITATAATATTILDVSLPVASNFGATSQCVGVGSIITAATEVAGVAVSANTTDDVARLTFVSSSTGARNYTVVFGYIVI